MAPAKSVFVQKIRGMGLGEKAYVKGGIPENKEQKIRKQFQLPDEEDLLLYIDNSAMGLSVVGIAFTNTGLYWKNSMMSAGTALEYEGLGVAVFTRSESSVEIAIDGEPAEILAENISPKKLIKVLNLAKKHLVGSQHDTVEMGDGQELPSYLRWRYFIPSHPESTLAKLQQRGFLMRPKLDILRDIILYSGIFALFFYFAFAQGRDLFELTLIAVSISLIYIIYFAVSTGLIWYWIGGAIFFSILTAIFPPTAILGIIIAAVMLIARLRSALMMLPWVGVGAVLYYGSMEASQFGDHLHNNQFLLAMGISALLAVFLSIRYSLKVGLFKIALIFGIAPVLALWLLTHGDSDADTSEDMNGYDLSDAELVIDDVGIKLEFPDGTYMRWIDASASGAVGHWRFYG